jgi:MFS family permease
VLIASTFVDRLGGTMMYPFFTLYVTRKFNVGMTEAGLLLAVFAVAAMLGGVLGGALSDKFGRSNPAPRKANRLSGRRGTFTVSRRGITASS